MASTRKPSVAASFACRLALIASTKLVPLAVKLRFWTIAFGTTSNLLSGTFELSCPRSDACREKGMPSMARCSAASNQRGPYAPV
jgi:hypothetical protein